MSFASFKDDVENDSDYEDFRPKQTKPSSSQNNILNNSNNNSSYMPSSPHSSGIRTTRLKSEESEPPGPPPVPDEFLDNEDDPPAPPPDPSALGDIEDQQDEWYSTRHLSAITSGVEINAPSSFASSMTANYEAVKAQIEAGMYASKRVASVIKKMNALQDTFAREIQKVLLHEQTKVGRLSMDQMKFASKAWVQTQEALNAIAKMYINNSQKIINEVVGPLQDWHAMAEEKRKELNLEERRATSEMAKAREEVVKGLSSTQKAIAVAIEATGGKKDGKKDKGFFATIQKKMTKSPAALQQEAAKLAQGYTAAIARANKRQTTYLDKDLPRIFGAMQQLEQQRLDIMKQRLQKFALIQHNFAEERTKWAIDLQQTVSVMDTDKDIKSFIEDWVYEHGLPNPPTAYLYSLPCTPVDIEAGRFEGNPKSVFRSTLERCMELQKSTAPTLDVPRIVPTLIKAIRDLNGFSSEGIFRISVMKSDLEALHKRIDDDNYDILSATKNPNVPAALLKEWLRLLAEPLIPESLYNDAISCVTGPSGPSGLSGSGGGGAVSTSQLLSFYERLPVLSRRVIDHIAKMAKEISSGENGEKSRMNIENLAIVFAPSFLRNPSEDPLKLLENSKFESKFTASLFVALAP